MDRNRGLDIGALRQQIEDLLDDFTGGSRRQQGGRPAGADQPQHLALNIVDSEDRIIVSAPLPGLAPEDIDITVRGQSLALRAHQKTPPTDRPQYLRREWGSGPYHRTIDLPSPVDADKAEASFRNGVVTITLPKSDANKARVITLQEDGPSAPAQPAAMEAVPEPPVSGTIEVVQSPEAPAETLTATAEPTATTDSAVPAEGATEEVAASFYMRPPRRRGGESRSAREAARRAAAKEKAAAEKAAGTEGAAPAAEGSADVSPSASEGDPLNATPTLDAKPSE